MGEWTNTECVTTPSNTSVDCGCDELSIYTMVDDIEGVFTSGKNVFDEDSFSAALSF
jgi:hypothetical protein